MAAKTQTIPTFDLDSVLELATPVGETKGKSKVPILPADDDEKKLATVIREEKDKITALTSSFEAHCQELLDSVAPKREALCLSQGYISSVKIPDTKGKTITIAWIDNYKKTAIEAWAALKEIVKDRLSFFTKRVEIKVREEKLNEGGLSEIMDGFRGAIIYSRYRDEIDKMIADIDKRKPEALRGKAFPTPQEVATRFAETYEVKQWIKPTSRFTQEQYTAFTPDERLALKAIGIEQFKPAVKP